jgi:type IV pilus assembly protein PilQ
MKTKTAVMLTVLAGVWAVLSPAQEPVANEAAAPAAEEVIETVVVESSPVSDASIKDGLITLSLKEVELSNVIRLFATLSEANIIIPDFGEAATGAVKIDVNLKNVEWKPALQSILDTQGLELFEKIPGTAVYSVRPKPADAPEPMSVKTFRLNYAAVDGVSQMISGMVPAPGKIAIFPARNTIVVQSTAENLAEVDEIIRSIDLPRQQVFIEAKFMELSDSASEQLGIDWQVLSGYNVGVKSISGTYEMQKMYDMNGDQYQDQDEPKYTAIPGTSAYDVSQAAPTFTEDPNTGIYERTPGANTYTEIPGTGLYQSFAQINEPTVATALSATLSASDFNLVLAALKEVGGTKVISNPKVIVANEEMATIHIGKKKPNVRGTTQTAGDSQSTTTYALDSNEPYFEDGIKVQVTPTINTSSNITVRIQPTLDRLDLIPFTAPDGTVFYGKSTKTITTLFSLDNGQTAAIGGLTQTSADQVERKVPLLGSLPLIGRFFSYSSTVDDQTETIIFVTVGLANPETINMNTGLPEESSLAMRQDVRSRTERRIKAEELNILTQHENERAEETVGKLREAEENRLEKETR